MIRVFCLLIGLVLAAPVYSQDLLSDPEAEERFRSQTKQINQFFRRFNGEEDVEGNRYYEGNKDYRDHKLRQQYISILFDESNGGISSDLKKDFIKSVTDKKEPSLLDFHKKEWFAEVNTTFRYKGKQESITLYMIIQPQRKGYEWVISDVLYKRFSDKFEKDTTDSKGFLHPMSHELDFMNLRKALNRENNPEAYTPEQYEPDFLTLFIYEMKLGNLSFETVTNVKFHFFQIDGWYFELSNFNRPGYNTGWLISNLVSVKGDQKDMLKNYIYGKR
mgnify:CR=1 FL=1